jgi:hypothetical protein
MQPKTFYERLDCSKFITKIPRNIPKELLHDWQYVGDKRAIDGAPLQIVMHFSPAKEAFYRGIPASRWGVFGICLTVFSISFIPQRGSY